MVFRAIGDLAVEVIAQIGNERAGAATEAHQRVEPANTREVDQTAIAAQEDSAANEKLKRPTRTDRNWTVRPPLKRTGAETPASNGTERLPEGNTASGSQPTPSPKAQRVLREVGYGNGKCRPALPKASVPPLGAGLHLRLVWNADHSPESHSIGSSA